MKPIDKGMESEIIRRFSYDPESGELVYKIRVSNKVKPGMVVGSRQTGPYRKLRITSKHMLVHLVAWFLHYGSWPNGFIDHIDGDGRNNSINNLRDCSLSENSRNTVKGNKGRFKTSQYFGVSKRGNRWQSAVGGKNHTYLGTFSDEQDAANAYNEYILSIGDNFRPLNLLDRHEVK